MATVEIDYIIPNPDHHANAIDALVESADTLNQNAGFPYTVEYGNANVLVKVGTAVVGSFQSDGVEAGEELRKHVESLISPESLDKIQRSFAGIVIRGELIQE